MTTAGTIGVHVGVTLREILDSRAADISFTRSSYAAAVLKWWHAQGAPAVTPADEAMQKLKALRVAEDQAKFGGKK